jgi:hypothetical protein
VEADEAKKAFHEAFTAFKAETITIIRDKENTQYSKPGKPAMYTSLENMVATVTPFLSKHGLSSSWEISQKDGITVTCVLTHVLGFEKRTPITSQPDTSGAKNPLQQIKSTLTYLKVASFESACGLASAFGSLNDDGNGAGKTQGMGDEDYVAWTDALENAPDLDGLKKTFAAAVKAADAAKDTKAKDKFIDLKDRRKGELQ